jgi:hypothetical protein
MDTLWWSLDMGVGISVSALAVRWNGHKSLATPALVTAC